MGARIGNFFSRNHVLAVVAAVILVLNLYDAMITLAVVESGLAVEANPLMRVPLEWGPGFFMASKILLVSAGVLLLWRMRRIRIAVIGMCSLAGVYILLSAYHFRSIAVLLDYVA